MKHLLAFLVTLLLCSTAFAAGGPYTGGGPFAGNGGSSGGGSGGSVSLTASTPDLAWTPSPTTGTGSIGLTYSNAEASEGVLPVANGGSNYHFPNFYPALAQVIAATGNAKICAVGDSTTFGSYPGPTYSYPTQLANMLTSTYGIKAHWNSWVGAGDGTQTFGANDSRITQGSSWTASTNFISLGVRTYTASTSTNAFSFTPTTNVDTFKIYYIINSSNGVLAAQIGSGSTTTQNTSTGTNNTIGSLTVTGTLGSNTLNLKWSSGGSVYVVGTEAWDSSQNWVSVINMGSPNSKASDWAVATNGYSPANSSAYAAFGCNLVIDDLGINDYNAGASVGTFTTNMNTLIAAQQAANADVVLMTPVPTNPSGGASVAAQYSFTQALRGIAATSNVPLVDLALRWQSYAAASPWSVYSDTLTHPNVTGYIDNAKAVLQVLSPPKMAGATLYGATSVPLSLQANLLFGTVGDTSLLVLQNTNTSDNTFLELKSSNATQWSWDVGVQNGNNVFGMYDRNNNKWPIQINTSDNVGFGNGCTGATEIVEACGNIVSFNGYIYQNGNSAAANANGYMSSFQGTLSTTNLNPGVKVFGGVNATNVFGMDVGYNSTSSRYRTRVFAENGADISFATHPAGTAPTAQSSFTDDVVIRGDTGAVGIGTSAPAANALLDVRGPVKVMGYTVGTLPSGSIGMIAYITDQTSTCPSPGGSITGSGAVVCPVFYNGSAWVGM
jgi:lysophospholipase L1-like esterase